MLGDLQLNDQILATHRESKSSVLMSNAKIDHKDNTNIFSQYVQEVPEKINPPLWMSNPPPTKNLPKTKSLQEAISINKLKHLVQSSKLFICFLFKFLRTWTRPPLVFKFDTIWCWSHVFFLVASLRACETTWNPITLICWWYIHAAPGKWCCAAA